MSRRDHDVEKAVQEDAGELSDLVSLSRPNDSDGRDEERRSGAEDHMGDGDVSFNLQNFLETMRQERRDDHKDLADKLDAGFRRSAEWSHNHELKDQASFNAIIGRLRPLEGIHRTLRWFFATAGGAAIVVIVGYLVKSHFNW